MDDIKKRAEQYAHSYPFAKVADAYEAGALAERERLTQWHDVSIKPPHAGMYLVKLSFEFKEGVMEELCTAKYNDGWTESKVLIDIYDYEAAAITAWREIE